MVTKARWGCMRLYPTNMGIQQKAKREREREERKEKEKYDMNELLGFEWI